MYATGTRLPIFGFCDLCWEVHTKLPEPLQLVLLNAALDAVTKYALVPAAAFCTRIVRPPAVACPAAAPTLLLHSNDACTAQLPARYCTSPEQLVALFAWTEQRDGRRVVTDAIGECFAILARSGVVPDNASVLSPEICGIGNVAMSVYSCYVRADALCRVLQGQYFNQRFIDTVRSTVEGVYRCDGPDGWLELSRLALSSLFNTFMLDEVSGKFEQLDGVWKQLHRTHQIFKFLYDECNFEQLEGYGREFDAIHIHSQDAWRTDENVTLNKLLDFQRRLNEELHSLGAAQLTDRGTVEVREVFDHFLVQDRRVVEVGPSGRFVHGQKHCTKTCQLETLATPGCSVSPIPVNPQQDGWQDTFEVMLKGGELTVTRTDRDAPWDQPLQLEVVSYMGFIFKEVFKTELKLQQDLDGFISWRELVKNVTQTVYELLVDFLEMDLCVSDIAPVLSQLKNADVNAEVNVIQRAPLLNDIAGRDDELVAAITEALETLQFKALVEDFVKACESSRAVDQDDEDYRFIHGLGTWDDVKLGEVAVKFERLRELFKGIGTEAGQIFGAVSEVENLVGFFRDNDFHSDDGRRAFDDIVNRATTACSHDPFLSDLVTAVLIDCHPQLAPFIEQDQSCRAILEAARELQDNQQRLAVNSIRWIKHANDNIAEVRLLFDAQTDTTAVNVQARVDALVQHGRLEIDLCRLRGKTSTWRLKYTATAGPDGREVVMGAGEIADFQQQLGFCSKLKGDEDRKAARFGKVLQLVQRYVQRWFTLEAAGHGQYQFQIHTERLREPDRQFEGYLEMEITKLDAALSDFQNDLQDARGQFPFLLLLENYDVVLLLNLLGSDVPADVKEKTVELLMTEVDWPTAPADRAAELEGLIDTCLATFVQLVSGFSGLRGDQNSCIQNGRLAFRDREHEAATNFHRLGYFFNEVFEELQLQAGRRQPQQYVYSIPSKQRGGTNHVLKLILATALDRSGNVPRDAQTLWCSPSTSIAELDFFFERIKYFVNMSFTLVGVDRLRPNSRDCVVAWQDKLSRAGQHGDVVYIFQDHAAVSKSFLKELKGAELTEQLDAGEVLGAVREARQNAQRITVVCGAAASGKTHWLRSQLGGRDHVTICINDTVDVHRIISKMTSHSQVNGISMCFNVSVHAPFADVNQFFYQLFVCGVVRDHDRGAIFALAPNNNWHFYVEAPYSEELVDTGVPSLKAAPGPLLFLFGDWALSCCVLRCHCPTRLCSKPCCHLPEPHIVVPVRVFFRTQPRSRAGEGSVPPHGRSYPAHRHVGG